MAKTPSNSGGLITETISTLTGGVSQQADAVRQPTQAKEIINCLLSPTEGLKKRPPSQIIQNLWPVFENFLVLAPYTRTTQDADASNPQITDLSFGLEEPDTKFYITIQEQCTGPFSAFANTFEATYVVKASDDIDDIGDGIALAINAVAANDGEAVVTSPGLITFTGIVDNLVLSFSFRRQQPISAISPSSLFTHVYNRDITEKYLLCVANGKLSVVDLLARDFPTVTEVANAFDYLETDKPGVSIRAITVGDYTFIVNREKTVRSAASLARDLVAHWSLEETSGPRFDDVGLNTLSDHATATSGTGKIGTAAYFASANSEYLESGWLDADNPLRRTTDSDFTFVIDVYLTNKAASQCFASQWDVGVDRVWTVFYELDTDRFDFGIWDGANYAQVLADTLGSPSAGTWYHILVSRTQGEISIQVNNGAADTLATSIIPANSSAPIRLGVHDSGAGTLVNYMNGRLDQGKFWNRLLTANEKTTLYNGGSDLSFSQIETTEGDENPVRDPEVLLWVRMGDYSTTYKIVLDTVEYSFTSSADVREEIDTAFIATALAALIPQNADGDYEVTVSGSTIRVRRFNDFSSLTYQDFTVSTSDGLGDQALRAIKGEIQAIEDLPARGINGFMLKVIGDVSTDKDDFYVVYDDEGNVERDGVWRETLKGGEAVSLDPATMPHILVRETDGSFTFQEATWDKRLVGDLVSAPFPSFIDKKISDVMFHKNRLGFVSDQNTVYSQVGKYYNFFRVSVQQLLDEDIIDYAIAATEIAPIRHVLPMQNKVTLWSDREQFVQGGEPIFTAKTVFADRVTGFECSHRVKPTIVGKDIFFCTDRNSATKLMEFYSTDSGTVNDAEDVTQIVPSYLKGQPLAVCGGQNANMIFVATLGNMNDLYVYNYLWNGQQLLQAAFSTWRFQDASILAIDFLENTLLVVLQRGPVVMLEKIEVLPADTDNQSKDTPSDHMVHLDNRFGTQDFIWFSASVAYASGRTVWTFASDADSVPNSPLYPMKVVTKATLTDPTTIELPDIQRDSPGKISAAGDWSDVDVWIGVQYEQEFEFSRLYPRETAEDGRLKAKTDGKTFVRNIKLDYKAGYFKVEVTPTGRSEPYIYEFDGGDSEVSEGVFEIPILNQNDKVRIIIKNQSHRPATFTGFSWDGMFQRRTG
jgi:hypothetical protein